MPIHEIERRYLRHEKETLTGMVLSSLSEEALVKRIEALAEEESKWGFVYVGEKLWLSNYHSNGAFARYDQWVMHVFEHELGLTFQYGVREEGVQEGYPPAVWNATVDANRVLCNYAAFKDRIYPIESELEIAVYGPPEAPSPAHIVKAFECLHDFEYMVSLMPYKKQKTYVEITGLQVAHPSCVMAWDLVFMSEYGSEWDQSIHFRAFRY